MSYERAVNQLLSPNLAGVFWEKSKEKAVIKGQNCSLNYLITVQVIFLL